MVEQKEELEEQRVWKPKVKMWQVSQLMILKRERILKKSQEQRKKRVLTKKVKRVQEKRRTREAASKRRKKEQGVRQGKVEEQGELRRGN